MYNVWPDPRILRSQERWARHEARKYHGLGEYPNELESSDDDDWSYEEGK